MLAELLWGRCLGSWLLLGAGSEDRSNTFGFINSLSSSDSWYAIELVMRTPEEAKSGMHP